MQDNQSLDTEFKRYLQILRPYVVSLVENEAIQICNEWIRRLNNCNEEEKPVRNKYAFVLCYQLAKGVLSEPFVNHPPSDILPNIISEVAESNTSVDLKWENLDEDDVETNVFYENSKPEEDDECHSTNKNCDEKEINSGEGSKEICSPPIDPTDAMDDGKCSEFIKKHDTFYIYQPEKVAEVKHTEMYESRAYNLILRLRNLKRQNKLLRDELVDLKKESGKKSSCSLKVDNSTSTYESSPNLETMKSQIRTLSNEKKRLLDTLESMKTQLDEFEEKKHREFEDLIANYQTQVASIKSNLRDEYKMIYEVRITELKEHYENTIAVLEKNEMKNALKMNNEFLTDLEKFKKEKNRELLEKDSEIQAKNKELLEKDNIIHGKNLEITHLRSQLDEDASRLQSMISRLLDNQTDKQMNSENLKGKTEDLEMRLIKMEKSKAKCIKSYEAKLSALHREKHLAECSLHLQLVKQRAQVVTDLSSEHQAELASTLDNLEAKYKEIVAGVQATAIRRTLQNEKAINDIMEAAYACDLRSDTLWNQTPFPERTVHSPRERSPDRTSEIYGAVFPNGRLNHSFVEDHGEGGFHLNGERLGELFEKVYIPMRDTEAKK